MTDKEVKEVVKITVDTLLKEYMISSDSISYGSVDKQLREHYKNPSTLITQALEQLVDHPYYDILELYYRDNWTLEAIAEDYDVDISTIVRNKKRLCIKIFNLIN